MRTTGNTVLITGATSGIGLELVKEFLKRNNTVVGLGRKMDTLLALRGLGQLFPFQCDLKHAEHVDSTMKEIVEKFPSLNVLINNAGVQFNYPSLMKSIPEAKIMEELRLNLEIPVLLTNRLLPLFLSKEESAVINITTGLALAPKRSAPFYCAAKSGLRTYTRALRYQLENSPVRIIEVIPPLVDTAMTAGRGKGKISPKVVAQRIIKGLSLEEKEIYIGKSKLLKTIMGLSPSLGYSIMKSK